MPCTADLATKKGKKRKKGWGKERKTKKKSTTKIRRTIIIGDNEIE